MAISTKPPVQEPPRFLDEVVLQLAADPVPVKVLAVPKDPQSVDDYETFTGRDLDRFVDATVKHLLAVGLSPGKHEPVGLYAHSGIAYAVTALALSRLGYSVLILSLRLGPVALAHLAKQTSCSTIIYSDTPEILETMEAVSQDTCTTILPIVSREVYDVPISGPRFALPADSPGRDPNGTFFIAHSSGSTGLPKPIFYAKSDLLQTWFDFDSDYQTFVSRPLYYGWSFIVLLQTIYKRRMCFLFNTSVPMTAENMTKALVASHAERVQTTPYNLELMASTSKGLEALRAAKMVMVGGAHLGDKLGDRLTAEGVRVNNLFGSSEIGHIGDSNNRPMGDPAWDYVHFTPLVKPHIHMEPYADDPSGLLHELYCKPSYTGLVAHNSDYPVPGSFRSKDLFSRHPKNPEAWKFVGRADDVITLSTGANVTPLTLEADIRSSNGLVRDAVVFGLGRPNPGLLIFRDEAANSVVDEDGSIARGIIKDIWPVVERQNSMVEENARIPVSMIRVLPAGAVLPATDKGNMIRSRVYKEFAEQIDEMYDSQ